MTSGARPLTLARHYLRWLAALYGALVLVTLGAVLFFLMWPMAQRSADDLVGLMQLSAQTWAELPPDTRPAFEEELLQAHRMAIRPDMPAPADDGRVRGFYIRFLERALERRDGQPRFLAAASGPDGRQWFWTALDAGGRSIGVGFDHARMNTRPLYALAIVLLAGSLLVAVAAWWLARRIAAPVAQLERAAAELAAGSQPHLLAESGPLELARLAGHFNHMALRVRELLEARTTLLAGVSHDLRTPLARMRLALEMLTLKPDPALIARLEGDVEAMNLLIGQMLDLSRGLGREGRREIDLAAWLRERADGHAQAARESGATIEVRCAQGLHLQAAAGMLERIADNLIGNALRYAPGAIELSAQPARVDGRPVVRIEIADRGPGIPQGQLESVWRPFQRVESSRSPQTGGYGLGLAIVRQLAQVQGWRVQLANRAGGGLLASIEIDAAPADAAGRPESAPH